MTWKTEKIEKVVFFSLLAIHFIYVWIMPVFLTQDGPSHLYNSNILLNWNSEEVGPFYQHFFDVNSSLFPNWFSSIVLIGLLKIFPAIIAEKIFISALMICLPLSFRYTIKSINPQAIFLSSLSFLVVNSYFLHYGFYNYMWSLVLFCLFIGFFYKNKDYLSWKHSVVLLLLLLLTFATHPVALILQLFVLGVSFVINLVSKDKRDLTKLLKLGVIAFPALLLFVVFFIQEHDSGNQLIVNKFADGRFSKFISASQLWVFKSQEKIVLQLYTLFVFTLAALGFRKIKSIPISLIILLGFGFFVYYFVNDRLTGGAYLTLRISIFIYLILILIASYRDFMPKQRNLILALSGVVCLSVLTIRFPIQYKLSKSTKQCIDVMSLIEDESTLLSLTFANDKHINPNTLTPNLFVLKHIGGYAGAQSTVLCFDNYEANTDYFPLLWKEDQNPYNNISKDGGHGLEWSPPFVDIVGYNERPDFNIDYVLLYGDQSFYTEDPKYVDLFQQLDLAYTLTQTAEDGMTQLYQLKR